MANAHKLFSLFVHFPHLFSISSFGIDFALSLNSLLIQILPSGQTPSQNSDYFEIR